MQLVMLTISCFCGYTMPAQALQHVSRTVFSTVKNEAEASHRNVIVGIPAAETDSLTGTHLGLYVPDL